MNRIGIILIFILKLAELVSQQSWDFVDKSNNNNEFIVHSIEVQGEKCVSISNEYYIYQDINDAIYTKSIIRIKDILSGQLITQSEYSIDSLASRLFWMFYDDLTKNYFIAGGANSVIENDNRGYFSLSKWDEKLNFLSDTIVKLETSNNHEIWYLSGNMKKDDEFLFVGYSSHMVNDLPYDTQILTCKLNTTGDIEKLKFHHTNKNASSIFFDADIDSYVLFSSTTFYLDSNLDILDTLYTYDTGHYHNGFLGQATKFSKNKYLVSTRYNGGNERGIAFFDTELNYLHGIKIDRNTAFDASIIKPNFDYIDTSGIYIWQLKTKGNILDTGRWIKNTSL